MYDATYSHRRPVGQLQGNPDGQTLLASTITPVPQSNLGSHSWAAGHSNQLSFGRSNLNFI